MYAQTNTIYEKTPKINEDQSGIHYNNIDIKYETIKSEAHKLNIDDAGFLLSLLKILAHDILVQQGKIQGTISEIGNQFTTNHNDINQVFIYLMAHQSKSTFACYMEIKEDETIKHALTSIQNLEYLYIPENVLKLINNLYKSEPNYKQNKDTKKHEYDYLDSTGNKFKFNNYQNFITFDKGYVIFNVQNYNIKFPLSQLNNEGKALNAYVGNSKENEFNSLLYILQLLAFDINLNQQSEITKQLKQDNVDIKYLFLELIEKGVKTINHFINEVVNVLDNKEGHKGRQVIKCTLESLWYNNSIGNNNTWHLKQKLIESIEKNPSDYFNKASNFNYRSNKNQHNHHGIKNLYNYCSDWKNLIIFILICLAIFLIIKNSY